MIKKTSNFDKAHKAPYGDFAQPFETVEAIDVAKGLTPEQRVREKVKHLSMQLFGLACDLGKQEGKFAELQLTIENKNKEIARLRAVINNQKVKIDKLVKKIKELQEQIT